MTTNSSKMTDIQDRSEHELIPLEPFMHQVGGHSSILCLDERTVCKPLIKQELKFYESLPHSMRRFTAEHRGVVEVRFEQHSDGYITVAAYPPKSGRRTLSPKKYNCKNRRVKSCGSKLDLDADQKQYGMYSGSSHISKNSSNPWAIKCHQRQMSKIRRSSEGSSHTKELATQKFILLENLTRRFEYPCVLDLKMGTRQYGDDASPAKMKSQIAKAASSTSAELGVRVCGMQVYQTTTGEFLCKDKYYGRKLSVDGFNNSIYQFLHNGKRLRADAIVPLIRKLEDLKAVLSTLDTFRFYTSSLLLMYEGLDASECDTDAEMEVENDENMEQDLGYEEVKIRETKVEGQEKLSPGLVDVRMIDFAHATHEGMEGNHSSVNHVGYDRGYVLGLSSLISVLKQILENHNASD